MGRMNDIEKKKTLHQVLSTIRGAYKKLFVILEFLKILNEYFAIKMVRKTIISSQSNLEHVKGLLNHCHACLSVRSQSDPDFSSVKSMLLSKTKCPDYFPNSIKSLSKMDRSDSSEIVEDFWKMTLDSQLRNELSKVSCLLPGNDVRLINICSKSLFKFRYYNYIFS